MPNSVTVISPVSGETLYLPGTQVVLVTFDYENGESGTLYACGTCTAGLPGGGVLHSGTSTAVGPGNSEAEVGLGDHSGTHNNVTLTGQLLAAPNSGVIYAQFSVNNITITDSAPPIRLDNSIHPIADERHPYFVRVEESALTAEMKKDYAYDADGSPRDYKAETDSPKRSREYDPTKDLELFVLIPNKNHRDNGYIVVEVSARKKKTDLAKVYTATEKVVVSDEPSGQCKVVIPKKVFKGGARKARQIVLTLLDKVDGDFVATTSVAVKPG
jgi:hypothetical protein